MDNIDPATIQRIMAALQAQGINPQSLMSTPGTPYTSGGMQNTATPPTLPAGAIGSAVGAPPPTGNPGVMPGPAQSGLTGLSQMPSGPQMIPMKGPMPPRDPRKMTTPGPQTGGMY